MQEYKNGVPVTKDKLSSRTTTTTELFDETGAVVERKTVVEEYYDIDCRCNEPPEVGPDTNETSMSISLNGDKIQMSPFRVRFAQV